MNYYLLIRSSLKEAQTGVEVSHPSWCRFAKENLSELAFCLHSTVAFRHKTKYQIFWVKLSGEITRIY